MGSHKFSKAYCLKITQRASIYVFLLAWAAFILFPLAWAFVSSFKPPSELFTLNLRWLPKNPTLFNYTKVLSNPVILRYLANTVFVSLISPTIIIALATMAGYGFSRFKLKGKEIGITAIIACQMFPPIMFIVPYFLIFRNLHIYNTYLALILTRVVFCLPFSTLLVKSFFDSIPRELEEAATVDGCSQFGTFYKIFIPLVVPAIATVFIFSFLDNWNEFLFSITVVSREKLRTITVALANTKDEYGMDWGSLMSLSLIAMLGPLVMFLCMQRYFIKGLISGAVKQ